jgi:integrase
VTNRKPITARTIASLARKPGRHPVANARGLFLTVKKTGGLCYWTFRFRFEGRESELSLGPYPDMTLDAAKAAYATKTAMVANGQDPRGTRRSRHPRTAAGPSGSMTFAQAAEAHIARRERNDDAGRNARHRRQWRDTMEALPEAFRRLPVNRITPEDVRDALSPIWDTVPTTAKRTRGRIEAVIASTQGSQDSRPNPAAWTPWMKRQLGAPRVNKDPMTGARAAHASMPFGRIPALMATLETTPCIAGAALQFLILAGARAGEVCGATWAEIDLTHDYAENGMTSAPMWVIPARRMKAYRRHRVPLALEALAILERQAAARGATIAELAQAAKEPDSRLYVFPGRKARQPIALNLMRVALRLADGTGTVHGLRAAYRSWCDSVGTAYGVAEDALAHAIADPTARAYFRPDQPGLRIGLSAAWAAYCTSAPATLLLPKPELAAA